MTLRLHYALRSDVGHVREGNEDSAYAGSRLLAVADGMGGHAAGEVASSTVISLMSELDEDIVGNDLSDALAGAVRVANARLRDMVHDDGSLDGMGTTVTALLASGSRLGVLHVGDSRAYLLRGGELVQVTHDHTLVQDLVDQGRITPEQATTHPQRSLLMKALDGRDVEPDVSVREAVRGDRYLLCTDGLSGVVSDETILEALQRETPQEAVDLLVDLALKGGGPDNITVVVADVVDDDALYDDHPMVAGAAAEKHLVPGALAARVGSAVGATGGGSAAAKAARIRRTSMGLADPDPHEQWQDEGGSHSRRRSRRSRRVVIVAGAVIVVLAVGSLAGWAYLRSQYYVGVDKKSNRVALFQGVDASLAGLSLSSVKETFMPVGNLQEFARSQVSDGIPANSRAGAVAIINGLAINPPTPTPTITVAPKPTARATPTVKPTVTTRATPPK